MNQREHLHTPTFGDERESVIAMKMMDLATSGDVQRWGEIPHPLAVATIDYVVGVLLINPPYNYFHKRSI